MPCLARLPPLRLPWRPGDSAPGWDGHAALFSGVGGGRPRSPLGPTAGFGDDGRGGRALEAGAQLRKTWGTPTHCSESTPLPPQSKLDVTGTWAWTGGWWPRAGHCVTGDQAGKASRQSQAAGGQG